MRVTMNDIAKKLNVSVNTVSKALGGKAKISEEMRNKIIKTAKIHQNNDVLLRFFVLFMFFKLYSLLSATTGSFLAALPDGIIPEKSVSATLITTSSTAAKGGR